MYVTNFHQFKYLSDLMYTINISITNVQVLCGGELCIINYQHNLHGSAVSWLLI